MTPEPEIKKDYWPKEIFFKSTKEWLKIRNDYIGASDVDKVIGTNLYGQGWKDIFDDKTGVKREFSLEAKKNMDEGNRREPEIITAYEKKTDQKVTIYKDRLFVHPDYPYLSASLDGFNLAGQRVVECKLTKAYCVWIDNKIPHYYTGQGQQQMLIMDVARVDFAFLHPETGEFKIIPMLRNDEFLQRENIKKGRVFWNRVLEKRAENEPLR